MNKFSYYFLLLILVACSKQENQASLEYSAAKMVPRTMPYKCVPIGKFEEYLSSYGLVNMTKMDSRIQVDLKYGSTDNFLGADVYGDLEDIFLQKEVAEKLIRAQDILSQYDSSFSLLVFDAIRPLSIQQKMWNIVQSTSQSKYVASPYGGGMHNYGCAVDVSIVDDAGQLLDMGTPFDYFGDLAQPRYNLRFLATGELIQSQVDNRLLLRKVMREAGFLAIDTEWWHFNAFSKEYVRATYKVVL